MPMTACQGFNSAPARKNLVKKGIRKCNDVQTSSRYLTSNSSLIYHVAGLDGTNMEGTRMLEERNPAEGRGPAVLLHGSGWPRKTPGRSPSNYGIRTDLVQSDLPYPLPILLSSFLLLMGTRKVSHHAMGGKHLLKGQY